MKTKSLAEFWAEMSQFSSRFAENVRWLWQHLLAFFSSSYNLLFIRTDCLEVGLDLQESLNFVTNNSLTGTLLY